MLAHLSLSLTSTIRARSLPPSSLRSQAEEHPHHWRGVRASRYRTSFRCRELQLHTSPSASVPQSILVKRRYNPRTKPSTYHYHTRDDYCLPGLTRVLVGRIALDFPAIFHLASFRNLKVLDASLSERVTQVDILSLTTTSTTTEQAGYFPKLKQISLDHLSLPLFTSLLKLVSSPDLEEVIISTSKASAVTCTSEDVSELLVELGRHTVLTCIIIYVASPVTGPRLNNTTFRPLLALPRICVLELDIAHPLDIDDELIASMASTWRGLVRLSLCVGGPRAQPDLDLSDFIPMHGATLFGLVPFALFCPELAWLGLPLDVDLWRNAWALHGRPGCGAALSEMIVLDVGLSVLYDPVPIAAFLSDLFPSLEGIRTAWRGVREEDVSSDVLNLWRPGNIVTRWEQVADLVDGFATVRKQERACRAVVGRGNGEPVEDTES